jgi:hypothetical protein
MLAVVRDLFIFSCYTGMAPVDLQRLKPHQIYQDADGIIMKSFKLGWGSME